MSLRRTTRRIFDPEILFPNVGDFGALRKGPPISWVAKFKGDKQIQSKSCQMGGREVTKVIQLLLAAMK